MKQSIALLCGLGLFKVVANQLAVSGLSSVQIMDLQQLASADKLEPVSAVISSIFVAGAAYIGCRVIGGFMPLVIYYRFHGRFDIYSDGFSNVINEFNEVFFKGFGIKTDVIDVYQSVYDANLLQLPYLEADSNFLEEERKGVQCEALTHVINSDYLDLRSLLNFSKTNKGNHLEITTKMSELIALSNQSRFDRILSLPDALNHARLEIAILNSLAAQGYDRNFLCLLNMEQAYCLSTENTYSVPAAAAWPPEFCREYQERKAFEVFKISDLNVSYVPADRYSTLPYTAFINAIRMNSPGILVHPDNPAQKIIFYRDDRSGSFCAALLDGNTIRKMDKFISSVQENIVGPETINLNSNPLIWSSGQKRFITSMCQGLTPGAN